jgi:hypothetical protein
MTEVSTHSMLTTFRRCPRQAMYKFHDEIRPKKVQRPLKMGAWFHELLEYYYKGLDWRAQHEVIRNREENQFFDEELGDVPNAVLRLMKSYLWHYQLEAKYGFKVLEVEKLYQTEWPDGTLYQCMVDLLVEWQGGLWLWDHKLRSQLPNHMQRLLDSQSLLYLWCARRNGIRVKGFIWNYIRMKPPGIPKVLKDGTLSKRKIETDYPHFSKAVRDANIDPEMYAETLRRLKSLYWRPNKVQMSPFFQRVEMEKDDDTIKRMALEMYHTKKRMARYNFDQRDSVERTIDRSCGFMCGYNKICSTELFGGNADQVRRLDYIEADPLDYYARAGN